MLTAQEAFKAGFLERCAADGLRPDEILARVKTAAALLAGYAKTAGIFDAVAGGVKDLGHTALTYGLPLALAAPPILGGAAGYGLAKATDVDDTDVDEIKNRELVAEYERQAERLKRQQLVRQHRTVPRTQGHRFM